MSFFSRNAKSVKKVFSLPSRTRQSFKAECDINVIMKRFKKSSGQDFLSKYAGLNTGDFGDFSDVPDYRTALDRISAAEASFMALPAKVRAEFQHDPASFLDFCSNPLNSDRLIEMGLATPLSTVSEESSENV